MKALMDRRHTKAPFRRGIHQHIYLLKKRLFVVQIFLLFGLDRSVTERVTMLPQENSSEMIMILRKKSVICSSTGCISHGIEALNNVGHLPPFLAATLSPKSDGYRILICSSKYRFWGGNLMRPGTHFLST